MLYEKPYPIYTGINIATMLRSNCRFELPGCSGPRCNHAVSQGQPGDSHVTRRVAPRALSRGSLVIEPSLRMRIDNAFAHMMDRRSGSSRTTGPPRYDAADCHESVFLMVCKCIYSLSFRAGI